MKFKFSLESYLELKKIKERDEQVKVAESLQNVYLAEKKIDEVQEKIKGLQEVIQQQKNREFSVEKLVYFESQVKNFKIKKRMLSNNLNVLNEELKEKRSQLIEATRQVKALEILKEKQKNEFHKKLKKIISSEESEINNRLFIRRKNEKAL